MGDPPPVYYDCIPFELHPPLCLCLYHQIDGDTLVREADEAARAEAEAADIINWGYSDIPDAEHLTRDTILSLFPTRDDWLSAHAVWSQDDSKRAVCAYNMAYDTRLAITRSRVEVEYRRDSVEYLISRRERPDYTRNWLDCTAYVIKMEVLLDLGGPFRQYENKLWALVTLMGETRELFDEFWDLEAASGWLRSDSSFRRVFSHCAMSLGPAIEDNLERLRTNLARMKSLQAEIQEGRAATIDQCKWDRYPPPVWLGGMVAPLLIERAPADDPLWTL